MSKNVSLTAALNELRNFKVFEGLALDEIQGLCENGQLVVNDHKQLLYQMGSAAHSFGIVLSGAYKLCRLSPEGEEVIIYFATPGDLIGVFIMPQNDPIYPVSAIAMGPSRFLKIPRELFLQKWKQRPDLLFKVQSMLSLRMGSLQSQKILTKTPLSAKLAHLLIDILHKYDHDDATLPLPLTRKEIANNLGVSVESVIRIMSDWSKRGLIETHDQHIRILQMDKLLEEMNGAQN